MIKYVFQRLLLFIPVLLAVAFAIFTMMYFAPGDPGTAILGTSVMPEAIEAFNEEIGWNDPFIVRFWDFLSDLVFHFDLGTSWVTNRPVLVEIGDRIGVTVKIATFCMLTAVMVGIPIGVLSAVKQYSIADNVLRVISVALVAIPFFWLGLMMLWLFSLKLHWFPSFGATTLKHYILPCVSLGLGYAAREMRMTRSCMLEQLRQDFIRTSRAKGASETSIIWRHAFKNSLMPIITMVGSHFGVLLGGALITESVFSMPGLGSYLITSVRLLDVPSVLGVSVVLASLFSAVMLVVDLCYSFIDPRVKARYT